MVFINIKNGATFLTILYRNYVALVLVTSKLVVYTNKMCSSDSGGQRLLYTAGYIVGLTNVLISYTEHASVSDMRLLVY